MKNLLLDVKKCGYFWFIFEEFSDAAFLCTRWSDGISQLGKFLESENNFPCHLDINGSCAQGDFSEWKIYFRQEPFSFIWLVGTFEFILFLKGMLVIFWGSFE